MKQPYPREGRVVTLDAGLNQREIADAIVKKWAYLKDNHARLWEILLLGVTQLGPNWVIPTAIYGVFWPITRHMWGSLPANCVSPSCKTSLPVAPQDSVE